MRTHRPWHTQNFLRHPSRIDRLIDQAGITPADVVLDLGAGRGALTARLAPRCRLVLAVEEDPLLAAALRQRFEASNVVVRESDMLTMRLPHTPYKVFANIPFDGSARLVRRLTSAAYPPQDAFLVIQREAAERILGQPRETLYGLQIRPWFEASLVHRFRGHDFQPPPRVDVVFLRLRKRGPPLLDPSLARFYADLLTYSFSGGPNLVSALSALVGKRRLMHVARALGISPVVPVSSISLECWVELCRELSATDVPRRLSAWRPGSARRRPGGEG